MKVNKIFKVIIIIITSIVLFSTKSKAANDFQIKLQPNNRIITEGDNITIDVEFESDIESIGFEMFIYYNEYVFKPLSTDSFIITDTALDETTLFYNPTYKSIQVETKMDEKVKKGNFMKIKLEVLDSIDYNLITKDSELFYIYNSSFSDEDFNYYENKEKSMADLKMEDDELYLSSDKYRIGETNVFDYEEGDKYITKISPNTTLADFKLNCKTNGNITVYKQDGEELGDDEYIGTGMTLVDELNGETITITLIVMGDVNGNGKIDTSDLTSLRGALYEGNELDDIALKALDIEYRNIINTKVLTILRNVLYEGGII